MNKVEFGVEFVNELLVVDKPLFDSLASFVHMYVDELGYLDTKSLIISGMEYQPTDESGDIYIWCSVEYDRLGVRHITKVRCDLMGGGYGWVKLYRGLRKYMIIEERDIKLNKIL